jgi:hypothetical protein
VTDADLGACNGVVHLLDAALQPCCTSVFEQLPQFSIVKIQPSYFDGYRQQAAPTNDDGSNRRLYEEAVVDLLLVRRAEGAKGGGWRWARGFGAGLGAVARRRQLAFAAFARAGWPAAGARGRGCRVSVCPRARGRVGVVCGAPERERERVCVDVCAGVC